MKSLSRFFIAATILLSGCTEMFEANRAPLDLPNPEPLALRPVKWSVVPLEEKDGTVVVLFALNEKGYKSLSLNIQDILTYMTLQKQILEEYRQYYEPDEQALGEEQR
jgi:hypothetical protein